MAEHARRGGNWVVEGGIGTAALHHCGGVGVSGILGVAGQAVPEALEGAVPTFVFPRLPACSHPPIGHGFMFLETHGCHSHEPKYSTHRWVQMHTQGRDRVQCRA